MDVDREVGWAYCLVSISYFWLAGPLAQLGFGCQIFDWLVTLLPGYRTLCSPVELGCDNYPGWEYLDLFDEEKDY